MDSIKNIFGNLSIFGNVLAKNEESFLGIGVQYAGLSGGKLWVLLQKISSNLTRYWPYYRFTIPEGVDMALSFKGRHFQKSIILACIRWYLSYKVSLRDLEEMMVERGVHVDHSTIHRWVLQAQKKEKVGIGPLVLG